MSGGGKVFQLKTLEDIITENDDVDKNINYLKIDIEGSEFKALPQWLENPEIMNKIDQIQIEIHTQIRPGVFHINSKQGLEELSVFLEAIQTMSKKYGFRIIDYFSNTCMSKNINSKGERYNTNFDITLYKD